MLSLFDDYPIHQSPDPITTPSTSDRDFYERYWFNGYSKAGDLYLGVGTGRYPHLDIADCGISIVRNGEQHNFHASARANPEPTTTEVGPFQFEIVEPMKSCRVRVEDNETDFACELLFEGRTANVEEPRHSLKHGSRRIMDTTRFAQLGHWSGWIRYNGETVELDRADTLGTKDRSWGVRPVGGGDGRGAPPLTNDGGVFFLWATLHWDDMGSHFQLFEDRFGRPLYQVGAFQPVYDSPDDIPGVEDPGVEYLAGGDHRLEFYPGTRRARAAEITLISADGSREEISLDPVLCFRMKGIGYQHPEWGHGRWKGELAIGGESWRCDAVDEMAFENLHIQQVVMATSGSRKGVGALEQIHLGPQARYGFKELLDPAR
jgi:hypothetical protein